jgi:hypothetical protein
MKIRNLCSVHLRFNEAPDKEVQWCKVGGAWRLMFGAALPIHVTKSVIEVVTQLKMIHSLLKFKLQNSPNNCLWYIKLVT